MTAKATILIDIQRTKHTYGDDMNAREVDMRDGFSCTKHTLRYYIRCYIPKAAGGSCFTTNGVGEKLCIFVWSKQLSISASLPASSLSSCKA